MIVQPHIRANWIALGLFLLGLIAIIIALQVPAMAAALRDLERSGYFGAVVAGALYGLSLTSATATVVFANIPETFNPVLIALLGGFGAMLYDVGVFGLTRRRSVHDRVQGLIDRFHHHPRLPRWASYLIGAVLIASPLPDELGAIFFGTSAVPVRVFLALSFALNTLGILVITGIF